MQRSVVVVIVASMLFATCGEEANEPITLRDADSGSEVALATGDGLTIELDSNPSTGYRWMIDETSMPTDLELLSKAFIEPDADLVGAPGKQVFLFEATSTGAGILRLEYLRPFDEPAIPDRIVEYIIRIDGANWPPDNITPPGTSTETAPDSSTSG